MRINLSIYNTSVFTTVSYIKDAVYSGELSDIFQRCGMEFYSSSSDADKRVHLIQRRWN